MFKHGRNRDGILHGLAHALGLGTIVDAMFRPCWTWQFLHNDPIMFANVTTSSSANSPDGSSAIVLADHLNEQFDASLSWGDIDWFRSIWDGKIIEDALLCVEHGVDAACLSNHGGRQLDGAPAAIDLVTPCRDAVGDSIDIIADGGVRRGSDIVKARALGADAVMTARPCPGPCTRRSPAVL